MALRIRCKCGKELKISSKLAGKKLLCPHCKNPFRISAEKFEAAAAAAKRRAAAKRGAPDRPRPPAAVPPEPARLDIQPTSLDAYVQPANPDAALQPAGQDPATEFQFSHSGVLDDQTTDLLHPEGSIGPPVAVPVGPPEPAAVGYAGEPSKRESYRQDVAGDAIQGPQRGFWADAFTSFIYPFKGGGNVITFLITVGIACLKIPLGFAGCLGTIGMLIIFGWLSALYLSVIGETARGSEDLPGIRMEGGFLDDVIKPALKFIGAYAVVLAPATLCSIALGFGLIPGSLGFVIPIWIFVGMFLAPISLLLFSLDALSMVLRIDLIFLTIIRTILPYLAMWLMLILVGIIYMLSLSVEILTKVGMNSIIPQLTGLGLAGDVFFIFAEVYISIVAMRIVGLYYLHFKKRFAIVME
jgi:hypothetical protein